MLCSHVCHFEAAETERTPVKDRQVLVGQHTLRLYGALSSDEASVLMQTRMEHCGRNAFLSRTMRVERLVCKCGRGDETLIHMLLRSGKCDEVHKTRQEAGRQNYMLGFHKFV